MNFFGRPKAAAPKRISKDAVLEQMKTLDSEISTYTNKETYMNKQIQVIRKDIKAKMSAKPPQKEAARRMLTKMKGIEKQLHVISGYMTRLEQIKSGLDTADMQASMVSTLTKGADTIAATLKGRDLVEEMADASDKLEEGLDVLDEVGEIMADPAGRLDAGELDDELAEIMNEDADELDEFEAAPAMPAAVPAPLPGLPEMSGLPAAPTSTALPAAPTTRHEPAAAAASSARAEDDEFADILGMMG